MPIHSSTLSPSSSAGGTKSADEDWTILPWYETIHKLTMSERITVGIGMSASQKRMWLEISKAAFKKGVFPDSYFDVPRDGDIVLKPDVTT